MPHFGDKSEIYWPSACSPQNVKENSDQKKNAGIFVCCSEGVSF